MANKSDKFNVPIEKDSFRKLLKYKKVKFTELARVTGWNDRSIRRAVDRGYMPYCLYIEILNYLGIKYKIKLDIYAYGNKKMTKKDPNYESFVIHDGWRFGEKEEEK